MSDASLEPARDLGRTSVPVGNYRLEVGPTPGMAISAVAEPPARAGAEQRQLARAAARADKHPGPAHDGAGDPEPSGGPEHDGGATLVGDVETVSDRADEVTTQAERADHLWADIAAGRLQITSVNNELDTLLALLQKLDRDGRFEEQLRLARALSKLLAVAMRWLDLLRSLRELLGAAERHGHDEARAWALHELGTLHLAAGHLVGADHDLSQAAELRRRLNDERGRAATERNLQVLCRTLRQMMRTRHLVERRGIRRFIPASNAVLAALVIVVLGAATAGAAASGLIGGAGSGGVGTATAAGRGAGGAGGSGSRGSGGGRHKSGGPGRGGHGSGGSGGSGQGGGKHGGSGGQTNGSGAGNSNGSGGSGQPAAPTISSVGPEPGSQQGGVAVTITGTNLGTVTSVEFGGASAPLVGSPSDTGVTVTSPPKAATESCLVTVTVTTADGQSVSGSYEYLCPTASEVGPPPASSSSSSSSDSGSTSSASSAASAN